MSIPIKSYASVWLMSAFAFGSMANTISFKGWLLVAIQWLLPFVWGVHYRCDANCALDGPRFHAVLEVVIFRVPEAASSGWLCVASRRAGLDSCDRASSRYRSEGVRVGSSAAYRRRLGDWQGRESIPLAIAERPDRTRESRRRSARHAFVAEGFRVDVAGGSIVYKSELERSTSLCALSKGK